MNETQIESFDDQSWKTLVKEFKERIKADNIELGINSVYLSDPEICCKPKYLLLGMEPSSPQRGAETMSFFPLFLHYCAYKYLCGGTFDYYIADFAKGAITGNANDTKAIRYPRWLPLFEKEWRLLGKPKIIAMSKGLYDGLTNPTSMFCFSSVEHICGYVYHYSAGNAAIHLNREYEYVNNNLSSLASYRLDEKEFREFAENKLTELLGPRLGVADWKYRDNVEKTLNGSHERERVFPLYGYQFEQVAKGGKIPHRNQARRTFNILSSNQPTGGIK